MAIKFLNGSDTQKEINSKGLKVVNFFATWCGPCQMLAPILEEIAKNIDIIKVDIDQNNDFAREMKVTGVPSTFIFKDGKLVEKLVGFTPKEVIELKLKNV